MFSNGSRQTAFMRWSRGQMNDDLRQDDIGVSAMSKYKNVRFVLVLFERHLDND